MMRWYFPQQLGGRNSSCSRVSDSTFTFPISRSGSCSNKSNVSNVSDSAVICSPLLFGKTGQQCDLHSFSSPPPQHHHGPLSRCKIYIFTRTKVNWFGNGFGEAICLQVSAKSLASVKVHSITPFLRPTPQFHNTGAAPVQRRSD